MAVIVKVSTVVGGHVCQVNILNLGTHPLQGQFSNYKWTISDQEGSIILSNVINDHEGGQGILKLVADVFEMLGNSEFLRRHFEHKERLSKG